LHLYVLVRVCGCGVEAQARTARLAQSNRLAQPKTGSIQNGLGFGWLGCKEMVVEGLVLGYDAMDVEIFGVGEGIGLELFEGGLIFEDLDGVFAHAVDVADVVEEAGLALDGDFGEPAGVGPNRPEGGCGMRRCEAPTKGADMSPG